MRKTAVKFAMIVMALITLIFINADFCSAKSYENPNTGYCAMIEDDANLLSEAEESELADTMLKITLYGNAAFKSIDSNSTSTENFIKSYYKDTFGTDSGTVFLIDMDNRNIWIYSDGAIYRTVTTAYANTITDNVYRYASRAEYFDCANEAFDQINTLLEGQKIRQPMKYISNALLAMILALLVNYIFVSRLAKIKSPSREAVMRGIEKKFECTKPEVVFVNQTRTYSPRSSDSGGSRSSGGGSSSSSGGSSGGGGGHSF